MTQNLIDFIRKWEGVRYNPYLDVAGVASIGVGFTTYLDGTKVTMQDPPLDDIQINRILNVKLEEFSRTVKAILGTELCTILPQQCIDALISFSYNLGCNSLKKSTLLKKIKANKNDLVGIKAEFMKWVNAGGKPVEGLKRRRNAEAEMYIDGILSQYTKREIIKMFAGV